MSHKQGYVAIAMPVVLSQMNASLVHIRSNNTLASWYVLSALIIPMLMLLPDCDNCCNRICGVRFCFVWSRCAKREYTSYAGMSFLMYHVRESFLFCLCLLCAFMWTASKYCGQEKHVPFSSEFYRYISPKSPSPRIDPFTLDLWGHRLLVSAIHAWNGENFHADPLLCH